MRQAQIFLYANGNDHPPTAIDLSKELLKDLLFNQSPVKVPFIKNEKKNACRSLASLRSKAIRSTLVTGYCFGLGFYEIHPFCTSAGEALTYWEELWFSSEILHRDNRRQCNPAFSSRNHVQFQSTGKSLPVKRLWSFTILFQATSFAQVLGGDSKDPPNPKHTLISLSTILLLRFILSLPEAVNSWTCGVFVDEWPQYNFFDITCNMFFWSCISWKHCLKETYRYLWLLKQWGIVNTSLSITCNSFVKFLFICAPRDHHSGSNTRLTST